MPKKRPRVQSVRTNKVDDPHTTRIKFIFEPINKDTVNGTTMDEIVEEITLISIIKPNGNDLNLSNTGYVMGGLDTNNNYTYFYCNVQPTPHPWVDDFFNTLETNEILTVKVNYLDPSVPDGDFTDVTYSGT